MANSLLDLYTFPKKKEVSVYPKNEMYNLLYKENPSIATPEVEPVSSSDSVVAQTAIANANTPAKAVPDFSGALPTPLTQPKPQNIIAQAPATTTPPYTPQTEYEKYWKTPVGTSKYNMPLDQFVRIAGLAAKYFDPQNPVANDLIRMGGEAYKERARREYEGPNVLLERRLRSAQAQTAESGLAGQKAMGDYVSSWPQRELTLKQKGMTQDAVDSEFVKGMIATIAPHSPEKAAALQEKMIEAKENRKLREYAQDMKDYFNELKIDQAIASGLRAERTLEEQKRHNKIIEKFREEEITDKKAKREEERWYPLGLDPDTKKVIFTDRKGNTKLGDLPPGVKSIAPKTEEIPTEKSKFTEDLYGKLRLKTINIERKQKGLPPLLELPDKKQSAVVDFSKVAKVPAKLDNYPSVVSVSSTLQTDSSGRTWKIYFDKDGKPVAKEQAN